MTFPLPNADPTVTLTTDASGTGGTTFDFKLASLTTPLLFDVTFRELDDVASPTSILLSTCFTVSAL